MAKDSGQRKGVRPIGPLKESPEPRWRLPEWLTRNFGWKVLSVVLAVLVWYLASYSLARGEWGSNQRREFSALPLGLLVRPGEPDRLWVEPTNVSVAVTGPRDLIRNLEPHQIFPWVDCRGILSAKAVLRPVRVYVPQGVHVLEVRPAEVRVSTIPPESKNSASSSSTASNRKTAKASRERG